MLSAPPTSPTTPVSARHARPRKHQQHHQQYPLHEGGPAPPGMPGALSDEQLALMLAAGEDIAALSADTVAAAASPPPSSAGVGGRAAARQQRKGGAVSLNHLLGFTYEQRGVAASQAHKARWPGPPGSRPAFAGGYRGRHRPHNRDQFVHALFRFGVRSSGDFSRHARDPDHPVPWEEVEDVEMLVDEQQAPTCPICLGPLCAAKVTRCGHVFCWPCILHHLDTAEKNWNNCPLCEDYVYAKDLRSVRMRPVAPVAVGHDLSMQLLCRTKTSTMPVPIGEWQTVVESHGLLLHNRELCKQFSKIWTLDQHELVKGVLDRELGELNAAAEGDHDVQFVLQAKDALAERAAAVVGADQVGRRFTAHRRPPEPESEPGAAQADATDLWPSLAAPPAQSWPALPAAAPKNPPAAPADAPAAAASAAPPPAADCPPPFRPHFVETIDFSSPDESPDVAGAPPPPAPSDGEQALPTASASVPAPPPGWEPPESSAAAVACSSPGLLGDDVQLFYQAADAQPVFLHSVNVRCLVTEFGNLEHAPPELVGKVLECETQTMTPALRKRFRHLRHLPLACEFTAVELDLTAMLSPATLDAHRGELQQRAKQRRRQQLEERRRARQAAAKPPSAPRPDIRNMADFPANSGRPEPASFEPDEFPASGPPAPHAPASAPVPIPTSATGYTSSFAQAIQAGAAPDLLLDGPTLAESMLGMAAAPATARRSPPVASSPGSGWGWGHPGSSPLSQIVASGRPPPVQAKEHEDDDGMTPAYQRSFSEDLAELVFPPRGDSCATDDSTGDSPKKGKKKKGKTLLFATNSQRQYRG